MKKILLTAAAVAFGLANATGIAHATDVIVVDSADGVPWSWSTQAQCEADGPNVRLDNVHEDAVYNWWYCAQGDSGLWYLHNTDEPPN